MKRRALLAILGSIVFVLLAAPSSLAATRFAAPADTGLGNCDSPANACDLDQAVESAGMNDEVIVKSATYNQDNEPLVFPANNLNVHGEDGLPKPVLNFGDVPSGPMGLGGTTVDVEGGSVSWLRIVSTDDDLGHVILLASAARVERVEVEGPSNACGIDSGGLLRDSFCLTTTLSSAVSAVTGGSGGSGIVKLRNVTAKTTDPDTAGVMALATGSGVTVDARNVIADGNPDAAATSFGGTPTLTLSYSNYATTAGATVTPAGSPTNPPTPPTFGANFFTQLASSVTVNAGAADADIGPMDIDGEPRSQGDAIDIGADEFPGNPPPPGNGGGGGTTPVNPVTPVTGQTGQAPTCKTKKKKKKKKRSASAATKKKKKKKKC
jgi:hypothetical protein